MIIFSDITDFISETYEDFQYWWEDFYNEYFAENEFIEDLSDGCSEGAAACAEYLYDLPADQIAWMILGIFIVVFILFRIFYWIFGDTEIW